MLNQVVVVALVNGEGQVFLMRRSAKRDIGCWEVPAGKVDEHESVLDAARRETREEAGLDLDVQPDQIFKKEVTEGRDGVPMEIFTFVTYLRSGWESARHKENHTFDSSGWFSVDKALSLNLTVPSRALVASL